MCSDYTTIRTEDKPLRLSVGRRIASGKRSLVGVCVWSADQMGHLSLTWKAVEKPSHAHRDHRINTAIACQASSDRLF